MKFKIISIIIAFLFLECNILLAQRPQDPQVPNSTQQQFNDMFFPKTLRTVSMIPCNPVLPNPSCNYIQNNQFNTTVFPYSTTDPFGLNQVPSWSNSHGQPDLANSFFGIAIPFGATNFAMMAFSNNGSSNLSDGIVQKIAPLQSGTNYVFRFWELNPNALSASPFDEVNIYLIRCSDYSNFNVNSNALPIVPTNSQQIFCETNLPSSTIFQGNPNAWRNRVLKFQANDNYDMIWIAPKPKSNGLYPPVLYCFGLPELINANLNITMSPNPPSPSVCQYTLQAPNCLLFNSEFIWTSPSGQTFNGSSVNVNVNNPLNVGTWTVTMQINGINPSNSFSCGNGTFPISGSIFVPACSTTPAVTCINLPLIQ